MCLCQIWLSTKSQYKCGPPQSLYTESLSVNYSSPVSCAKNTKSIVVGTMQTEYKLNFNGKKKSKYYILFHPPNLDSIPPNSHLVPPPHTHTHTPHPPHTPTHTHTHTEEGGGGVKLQFGFVWTCYLYVSAFRRRLNQQIRKERPLGEGCGRAHQKLCVHHAVSYLLLVGIRTSDCGLQVTCIVDESRYHNEVYGLKEKVLEIM